MQLKQKVAYMAVGCAFTLLGFILASIVGDVTAQNETTQQTEKQSVEFDEIKCRSLKIVDEEGKVYAELEKRHTFGGGHTVMKVFNHEGTVVGQLGYDNNGGFMLISYKDGTENITIGIGENTKGGFIKVRRAEANNNFVVITNKTILVQGQKGIGGDKGYAIMTTDEDGNGIVGVRSKSNKGTAQMTVNGHGGTLFVTDGLAGGEKASLGVNEHGGRVDIFGKGTKTTRAAMGVNEYGSGTISLWDKNSYRIQR